MDTAIVVAVLALAGTIVTALLAWHSSTANARTSLRNAAAEAAERTRREFTAELERARDDLGEARAATDRERENLLGLRNKRLEEMANQLGSARQSLAIARKEAAALASENDELRRALGHPDGAEHGGMT